MERRPALRHRGGDLDHGDELRRHRRRRQPAVAAVVARAGAPSALPPDPSASLQQNLDAMYEDWVQRWGIVGGEVAVTRPNEFLWQRASGVDITGAPARVDTRFDIGSITKTFTTALLMPLLEDG